MLAAAEANTENFQCIVRRANRELDCEE